MLKQVWESLRRSGEPGTGPDPEHETMWLKARAEALRKAGLDTLWDAGAL